MGVSTGNTMKESKKKSRRALGILAIVCVGAICAAEHDKGTVLAEYTGEAYGHLMTAGNNTLAERVPEARQEVLLREQVPDMASLKARVDDQQRREVTDRARYGRRLTLDRAVFSTSIAILLLAGIVLLLVVCIVGRAPGMGSR